MGPGSVRGGSVGCHRLTTHHNGLDLCHEQRYKSSRVYSNSNTCVVLPYDLHKTRYMDNTCSMCLPSRSGLLAPRFACTSSGFGVTVGKVFSTERAAGARELWIRLRTITDHKSLEAEGTWGPSFRLSGIINTITAEDRHPNPNGIRQVSEEVLKRCDRSTRCCWDSWNSDILRGSRRSAGGNVQALTMGQRCLCTVVKSPNTEWVCVRCWRKGVRNARVIGTFMYIPRGRLISLLSLGASLPDRTTRVSGTLLDLRSSLSGVSSVTYR
ncbi:hypothetical protein GOBAR_DD34516 [Gossypium barbadense]|nr:hypothetical protein GOBAR_DD34516 [Gossypium barbadense]